MNLQEFIEQTLLQVAYASKNVTAEMKKTGLGDGVQNSREIKVYFDIAITAGEEKTNGISGGLKVINAIMLGAQTEEAIKTENISRIKLELPLKVNAENS
ncbi:MAG: hypothetical protein RLY61_782 [Candidatus Parcubacteria bacterium]|jgi:hypothetical protein